MSRHARRARLLSVAAAAAVLSTLPALRPALLCSGVVVAGAVALLLLLVRIAATVWCPLGRLLLASGGWLSSVRSGHAKPTEGGSRHCGGGGGSEEEEAAARAYGSRSQGVMMILGWLNVRRVDS